MSSNNSSKNIITNQLYIQKLNKLVGHNNNQSSAQKLRSTLANFDISQFSC